MGEDELTELQLRNVVTFDRGLSLAIDAVADELDRLGGTRGLWAGVRRWWLARRLRRLERGIWE